MSRITALVTVLVLGASASAAMASPRQSSDGRRDLAPTYGRSAGHVERGHIQTARIERTPGRFDHVERSWRAAAGDDVGPRRYRPSWIALGAPLQLGRTGQGCVDVADLGTFTQLRLQTEGGLARVDRVVVQFADGSDQVIAPRRVLDDRGDLLEIPLDGNNRQIDRILVTGTTRAGGALEVYAI